MKKAREILYNLRQESTYGRDEYCYDEIEKYNEDVDIALKELKELMPSKLEIYNIVENVLYRSQMIYETFNSAQKNRESNINSFVSAIHKLITERLG